jgi:hypothetical protein
MLRVREVTARGVSRDDKPVASSASATVLSRGSRPARLAAMAALGLSLGAGGALFTVSLVQAEDDGGVRAFQQQEAASRRAARAPQQGVYASSLATAYAPSRGTWQLPLLQMKPDGRIAHPPINLNPFQQRRIATAAKQPAKAQRAAARLDTVSGAADIARSICVRLCDGFHAPLGYVQTNADLKAHEVLCQAMNPGVPVKVFRVAAGANTIDDARSADGKQRYSTLPMAYAHEKSADPACRPAIVQAGERRISLLRDFTLRPGDSVVLDGKVRTFAGGSRWPYSTADFRDFRSSAELNKAQRQQIDDRVGVSRMEAEARSLRRQLRLREASLQDGNFASDAISLRGSLDPSTRGPVRIIPIVSSTSER